MRYYSTQRPVTPGSFPRPEGNRIVESVNFDSREYVESIGRNAWGYIEYEKPLAECDAINYELTPARTGKETFANVEQYMERHDFLPADKSKVRKFLRDVGAVAAVITRHEIRWEDKNGIKGVTGRGNIGIQDNF